MLKGCKNIFAIFSQHAESPHVTLEVDIVIGIEELESPLFSAGWWLSCLFGTFGMVVQLVSYDVCEQLTPLGTLY